jgi:hypothetical protein
VNLGGASLLLYGGQNCQTLPVSTKASLVATASTLTGTFRGVHDGGLVQIACAGRGAPPVARIRYMPSGVLATIVGPKARPIAVTVRPSIRSAALTGVVQRRLRLSLSANEPNPALKVNGIVLSLPAGLRLATSATTIMKGVTVDGASVASAYVRRDRLDVSLDAPTPRVSVTIAAPAIRATRRFSASARKHPDRLRASVVAVITDNVSHVTRLRVPVHIA